MTAIIKNHIDYGEFHCEMKRLQPAEDTDGTLSEHDKRVLNTYCRYCQAPVLDDVSLCLDNLYVRHYLNGTGVLTASGKQSNSKRLQNFHQRMVQRKNAVIDYILHQAPPAASSQNARLMDDKEISDVNVSLPLNIMSGDANHIDYIGHHKK